MKGEILTKHYSSAATTPWGLETAFRMRVVIGESFIEREMLKGDVGRTKITVANDGDAPMGDASEAIEFLVRWHERGGEPQFL